MKHMLIALMLLACGCRCDEDPPGGGYYPPPYVPPVYPDASARDAGQDAGPPDSGTSCLDRCIEACGPVRLYCHEGCRVSCGGDSGVMD